MSRPLPHVDGVRHRDVTANGVRLHLAEAGAEDAPGGTVVMLHGWPQHWYEWRHVIPGLAERHRVLCPDLRGFGWSQAPPGGYDKETLADDVLALLDELGLERVHLVGHDWGGWVGFLLCLLHPERVERYLPINIPHPWQRTDLRTVSETWRLWYQWVIAAPGLGERAVARMPRMGDSVAGRLGFGIWTAEERREFFAQFQEPDRVRASVQLYRAFQLVDLPRSLSGRYRKRLRTPTLMLYGTEDQVVRPRMVEGFEPHADDMRLERIPGVGHFVADEVPELVVRRALEHFGAVSPAAPAAAPR